MRKLSIRARLALWFSAVVLVCLAAAGAMVWAALRQSILSGVERDLQGRVAGLSRILQIESGGGEPDLVRLELEEYAAGMTSEQSLTCWQENERVLFTFPAAPHRRFLFTRGTVNLNGHPYVLELGMSLEPMYRTLRLLGLIMLVSVPVMMLLASGGGWWLSRRALAPIDAMTREANQLGIRNLSARLPEPGTGDELDRFARAWNELLGRLQAAVERLSRFTADASHELRSPVAVIRTTAELALRQNRSPDEYLLALSQIEAESRRMTELIEDLLALARSDEGAPDLERIELSAAVAHACSERTEAAAAKGIAVDVQPGLQKHEVLANPAMLHRIIVLLLDNAVKYTPTGGRVAVRAGNLDEGRIVVEISDTGPGIAPEDIAHIFERFWRADPARSTGGTGLGLSLAKAIAEAHGGRLEVDSIVGRGSTFRFTLTPAPALNRPGVAVK